MNRIGITNENEFYSQHYLSEIFTGDVRGVLETWTAKETGAREAARAKGNKEPNWRNPWNVLGSLDHLRRRAGRGPAASAVPDFAIPPVRG